MLLQTIGKTDEHKTAACRRIKQIQGKGPYQQFNMFPSKGKKKKQQFIMFRKMKILITFPRLNREERKEKPKT